LLRQCLLDKINTFILLKEAVSQKQCVISSNDQLKLKSVPFRFLYPTSVSLKKAFFRFAHNVFSQHQGTSRCCFTSLAETKLWIKIVLTADVDWPLKAVLFGFGFNFSELYKANAIQKVGSAVFIHDKPPQPSSYCLNRSQLKAIL